MTDDQKLLLQNQLRYASILCGGSDNTEYIRGIAELLAQFSNNDHTLEENIDIITKVIS